MIDMSCPFCGSPNLKQVGSVFCEEGCYYQSGYESEGDADKFRCQSCGQSFVTWDGGRDLWYDNVTKLAKQFGPGSPCQLRVRSGYNNPARAGKVDAPCRSSDHVGNGNPERVLSGLTVHDWLDVEERPDGDLTTLILKTADGEFYFLSPSELYQEYSMEVPDA